MDPLRRSGNYELNRLKFKALATLAMIMPVIGI